MSREIILFVSVGTNGLFALRAGKITKSKIYFGRIAIHSKFNPKFIDSTTLKGEQAVRPYKNYSQQFQPLNLVIMDRGNLKILLIHVQIFSTILLIFSFLFTMIPYHNLKKFSN